MVAITRVMCGSPAARYGITAGAQLVSVNGHEINDVLDYGFYTTVSSLLVVVRDPESGYERTLKISKGEYDELGLESESFLMDKQHRCENNCVFCFIDQLPQGLRESLYFKDDDERLSYLFGNYVTLTNLSDIEVERIIEMKISPVNISVHTTNPELRCKLMGNRFAGEKLRHLYHLAQAGTPINCQIVLCRGLNDGEELRSTLLDLVALMPAVQSVACVPVGLTSHREGLYSLERFDVRSAADVLDIIDEVNQVCSREHGCKIVYPGDELFLLAGRAIPDVDYYGELLQIENGVGMLSLFTDEFLTSLECAETVVHSRRCALVTGEAAAPSIRELVAKAADKLPEIHCDVFAIKNNFFGGCVSVAGLVTATDIIKQLKGKLDTFDIALIPETMLRSEGDMFLDSVTLDELATALGIEIRVTTNGVDLVDALTGR
ncbi:MAG: DUF512 domain-containing protein [Oscillospiraceae bacterium]